MNGELISVLVVFSGVGGALAGGVAGPVNHGWGPSPSALKLRLFMIGNDLPTRWRRVSGLMGVAGLISSGAALSYAAAPSRPATPNTPHVQAVVSAPPVRVAAAPATAAAAPQKAQLAILSQSLSASETANLPAPADAAPQRPASFDISRPLDAAAIEFYYQQAVAQNPTLRAPRAGLTAEEARRLTALEGAQAAYWAAQPAWSRRNFASYDDAVGVMGKANADEMLALQQKWKQAPIVGDLDQLAALSAQDRQAEVDRRGAALAAKLAQRGAAGAGSPQYATLSRDISDAQANLADIQARYGITPRQP